jgi:hypothetical protein
MTAFKFFFYSDCCTKLLGDLGFLSVLLREFMCGTNQHFIGFSIRVFKLETSSVCVNFRNVFRELYMLS